MAGTNDQDTVIVRLMDNGYIRSHLKEVGNLQVTSGIYYTLYGDNAKLDEKTEKKIDLQKNKMLKEYENIAIFIFNTSHFNFTIDLESESKDFMKIKSRVICTAALRNNKLSLAEKVDLRTAKDVGKIFCKSDFVKMVSRNIEDEITSVIKTMEAQTISDNPNIVEKNSHIPASVKNWTSNHGFSIVIEEINILSNEYDTHLREENKKKKDAERRKEEAERIEQDAMLNEKLIENEKLKSQLKILKAKNELDEKTGETRDTIAFKKLHANNLAHGIMDGNGEFYESDEYIIGPRSNGVLISRIIDAQPFVTIPHKIKGNGETFTITDVGPNLFKEDPKIVTEVIIEEGITGIERSAFQNCINLVSVKMPSTLRRIEANAFNNCPKLRSLTIPAGIEHIDENAFNGCFLSEIIIPHGIDISNVRLPRTTAVREAYDD